MIAKCPGEVRSTTMFTKDSKLRCTRFRWIAVAVLTIAAVAAGATMSAGAPALNARLAGRASIGGPTALHTTTSRSMSATDPYAGPTPDIPCDKGSMPETVQGKTPKGDYDSGRAAKGYFCNARQVSRYGHTGATGSSGTSTAPDTIARTGTPRCCGRTMSPTSPRGRACT